MNMAPPTLTKTLQVRAVGIYYRLQASQVGLQATVPACFASVWLEGPNAEQNERLTKNILPHPQFPLRKIEKYDLPL